MSAVSNWRPRKAQRGSENGCSHCQRCSGLLSESLARKYQPVFSHSGQRGRNQLWSLCLHWILNLPALILYNTQYIWRLTDVFTLHKGDAVALSLYLAGPFRRWCVSKPLTVVVTDLKRHFRAEVLQLTCPDTNIFFCEAWMAFDSTHWCNSARLLFGQRERAVVA